MSATSKYKNMCMCVENYMYLFTCTYVCEFEKYINMYIYTDPYDYEKQ